MSLIDVRTVGVDLPIPDPLAIAEAALDMMTRAVPDFDPRDGSQEVLLIEAGAAMSADVRLEVQSIVSRVIEGIIRICSLERVTGMAAVGTVTVSLDTPRTLTIPAGTQLGDPVTGIVVETAIDTPVTTASTITLVVRTTEAGSTGNALMEGTLLDIYDNIPGSISAVVSTSLSGGADAETDEQYFARGSTLFARITSSLVLPIHFTAYVLEDARAARATAIDNFAPGGTLGEDYGHITVYCYGRGGQLSTDVRTELQAAMAEKSSALVTVHVEPADVVSQELTLTVQAMPGYSTSDVRDAVIAALRAWMSPDAWTWGRDIMPTEIIDIAADVPGVDYVDSVTVPFDTVDLAASQLAQAGTITVTVTT